MARGTHLLGGAFRGLVRVSKGILMRELVTRFVREDDGQDLIEYAFLAMFIALAVTVGLTAITDGLNSGFSNIGTQVSGS